MGKSWNLKKRAVIAKLDVYITVPSDTMSTQIKWMTFPVRVVYHEAIQMYKTVCGDAHDYLTNDKSFLVFTSEIHSRFRRSSSTKTQHRINSNTDNTLATSLILVSKH